MLWATTVVNMLKVPVEKPMAPPRTMMASPVKESSPMAMASITITGAKGMKVFTPWVVQIRPKIRVSTGMKISSRLENFRAPLARIAWRAPVLVTTWKAAPAMKITIIRSIRLLKDLMM